MDLSNKSIMRLATISTGPVAGTTDACIRPLTKWEHQRSRVELSASTAAHRRQRNQQVLAQTEEPAVFYTAAVITTRSVLPHEWRDS